MNLNFWNKSSYAFLPNTVPKKTQQQHLITHLLSIQSTWSRSPPSPRLSPLPSPVPRPIARGPACRAWPTAVGSCWIPASSVSFGNPLRAVPWGGEHPHAANESPLGPPPYRGPQTRLTIPPPRRRLHHGRPPQHQGRPVLGLAVHVRARRHESRRDRVVPRRRRPLQAGQRRALRQGQRLLLLEASPAVALSLV